MRAYITKNALTKGIYRTDNANRCTFDDRWIYVDEPETTYRDGEWALTLEEAYKQARAMKELEIQKLTEKQKQIKRIKIKVIGAV